MRKFIHAGTAKTTLMELENENVAEKPPHRGSLTNLPEQYSSKRAMGSQDVLARRSPEQM
jgi:hypothetical protein